MCTKYVIKRNGDKEKFDLSKVKLQIAFVCKGTEVNTSEFEAKFNVYLPEVIKTSEIQTLLLSTAIKEISPDTSEWDLVAGRLAMWDTYGRVYKNTGIKFENWIECITYLSENKRYIPEVLEKIKEYNLTNDDISYGTWKNIDLSHPDFNKVTRQSLIEVERYLVKDVNGPIEYPFIQHIANALLLSANKEDFIAKYKLLASDVNSLGTPFKRNLRLGGNCGSCFIGGSSDSLASITKSWSDVSQILKEGGGVGWDLTSIRPSNSYSNKIPKSNNIIRWVKIFNDIAIAVDQAGVRKGAITIGLRWWHLDLQDFVEARVETKGDLRNKTFDIFPQVVVDNYFMEKVANDEYVYQFNHYYFKKLTSKNIETLSGEEYREALILAEQLCKENKLKHYRKVKARNLFSKVLWHWVEVGSIYIANFDNLNKSNYLLADKDLNKRIVTPMSNLCNESFSVVKPATSWTTKVVDGKPETIETDGMYHNCNLISINLVKCMDLTEEEFANVVYHAVDMADKSTRMTKSPVQEAENGVRALSNVGIGLLGLADVMAYNKLMYDKEDGIKFGSAMAERLVYHAYKASVKIAKQRGSYEWFNKNNYDKLLGEPVEKLNKLSKEFTGNNYDWGELQKEIKEYGIANFLLTAIAPNTSTSSVMGVMPSYLPAYNKFYYETMAGLQVPVLPVFIKDRYWYYKTRTQYKTEDIIVFTRALQQWIDTGISMELNMNPTISNIDTIHDAIVEGFLSKDLKAVYYCTTVDNDDKTGSKENKKENSKTTCIDCSN